MINIEKIRNVAFASQSNSGKSTLIAHLLAHAQVIPKILKKEESHFISDYTPEEKERRFTHTAKVFTFPYEKFHFTLIDTPGYPDFIGEVIEAFFGVEGVVLVVDAGGNIEVQTERIWALLEENNLPHVVFISKMDRPEADFTKILQELERKLHRKFVPLVVPKGKGEGLESIENLLKESKDLSEEFQQWKEMLQETAAEADDALTEKYLEGGSLSLDDIKKGLQIGIREGKISPVLCGSSYRDIGIKSLLQFIIDFFPHPGGRKVLDKDGKEIDIEKRKEPLAQVFKVITELHLGEMALFKVFSGTIASSSFIYNSSENVEERLGAIQVMVGGERKEVEEVGPGEIAAIGKLKSTKISDTLSSKSAPVKLKEIKFPSPTTQVAVIPRDRKDEEKISFALEKLCREDPTLKISFNKEFGELVLSGMGELSLDTASKKLVSRYGVNVDFKEPRIPYRETVKGTVKMQGKYKRQTGGHGQYGDVWLEIEPKRRGEGIEFVDEIVGGKIPGRFIPSVEKGVRDTLSKGVMNGYPITDIKVILYDGSFHPVDSSDIAFQIAGSMALKEAIKNADPTILEPIMEVEVTIPDEYVGDMTGDLNSRRGRILNIESKHTLRVIKAKAPLSEMQKYTSVLKSLTQGRGTYQMNFSNYEEVPPHIMKKLVEEGKKGEV